MVANVSTLSDFADGLANQLGSPVVDKTGITGTYDFVLNFAPEPGQGPAGFGPPPPPPPGGGIGGDGGLKAPDAQPLDAPPILTAVQEQLGLKLEKKKGPVDILVIDHIEKTPTEN